LTLDADIVLETIRAGDISGLQSALAEVEAEDVEEWETWQNPVSHDSDFNDYPHTPLSHTVKVQNEEIVDLLLDAGFSPLENDGLALNAAFKVGNHELVLKLLAACPKKKHRVRALRELSAGLVERGDLAGVRFILDNGVKPTKPISRWDGTLMYSVAAGHGQLEIMKLLEDEGADPHAENEQALFAALEAGQAESLKHLIAKGAFLGARLDELKEIAEKSASRAVLETLKEHDKQLPESPEDWRQAMEEFLAADED